MKDFLKRELSQVSSWLGVAIGILGNVLPYLTPDTLETLGVPKERLQVVSTLIGLALVAYREQPKAQILPPPSPEATRPVSQANPTPTEGNKP